MKKKMVVFFIMAAFLISVVVIDGNYSSVSAEPHQQGKKMGMSKVKPEVDRSGLPQMSLPMAIAAGTVMRMSNCASDDCHQGDWINNNWLVYHSRGDYHLYKTDGVSNVELPWSGGSECDSHPDANTAGTLISFQRLVYPGGGYDYCSEIWTMDINGANQKRLVSCDPAVGGAHEPKWSPDGKYIAYTQDFGDHDYKELSVVGFPVTLKAPTRLTFNANAPHHNLQWLASRSSWLGLGSSILGSFEDNQNGYRNVAKVGIYNAAMTYLSDNTDVYCELMPVPTSTGKIVYMSDIGGYGDIYIMNQDGTNKTRLTDSSDRSYCSNHPEPTPNGKYVAYWSEDVDGAWRIWMMTANGMYKGVVVDGTVVNNQAWSYRPLKFNPAGTKLLFTGCTTPYDYYCNYSDVYSLNLDTADTDGDKLLNYEEVICGTNAAAKDSDSGGEDDYSEVNAGRDPMDPADDIAIVRPIWGW